MLSLILTELYQLPLQKRKYTYKLIGQVVGYYVQCHIFTSWKFW